MQLILNLTDTDSHIRRDWRYQRGNCQHKRKKNKRTNNYLQNITHRTKDWV